MDIFKTLLLDTPVSTAISGTVAVNQGGTGATTAADARVNLLPSYTGNANKVLSLNSGATDVEWTTNGAGTVTSVDLTAGTGISVSGGPITSTGSITVTNTAPDQTVVLTASTGISTSGTYPNFTITNSAPDQTVVLTQGGTTTITGTYPNFTISSADQYKGTVTSVDFSGGTTGLTVSGNPITSSGTITLAGTLAVANGGTGLTSGTSGGVLAFTASGTLASSSALASNAIVVGGGAGAAPSTITTGTGVATALAVNTGTSGAFVVNGGALGTPSSGTVTNLTGTASININGTVGATTANTGAFTTLSASSTVSGTGFSTYLASPPAIGGTAPAAGKFTTLEATGVTTVSAGTVSAPAITTTGDTNTGIFFPAADNMAFTEGGVEVFRIESNGRFGLGQTSPATKFDLSGNYGQNIVAVAALDIDCSAGNYFTKTINANSTFTFSNAPASRSYAFALELTHTSGTVTWPTAVKWPKDTAPTLTTGKTHIFIFVTDDGGTRWRGAALVDYVN
jgi:hypothetical protein